MSASSSPVAVRPFVSPARVLAGCGSATRVGGELLAAGASPADGRVLLVADAAVLDLGLVDGAAKSLTSAGFAIDVRPGVSREPTPATIAELVPSRLDRVVGVVAVGGGSALDAAKLAALASTNALDLTAGLAPTDKVAPAPPVIAVPTTAGTGSEATAVAMLWHMGAKCMFVHPWLVPVCAVLDPDLLDGLPAPVTAAGGLDAISHAVESLLSTYRAPLSEISAKAALALLARSVPAAYETGDADARSDTLLGAFQAGLALNASVVLGHSLAYVLAARAGLPHGVSCAMALPYCLAHARPARESTIAEIAEIVCGEPDAERFVAWLLDANAAMGIPAALDQIGITASMLPEMARECTSSYPRPNHPRAIHTDEVEALLGYFLHGDAYGAWREGAAGAIRESGSTR